MKTTKRNLTMMWELFWVDVATINEHIKNIYSIGELKEEWTLRKILIVQKEWSRNVKRNVGFYNLDVILSVWYRVTSIEATKFRIWANSILKAFLVKWVVLDKERLKKWWEHFWKDHFQELIEEIREIRASERMSYKKVTDVFSLSEDYNPSLKIARGFFFLCLSIFFQWYFP